MFPLQLPEIEDCSQEVWIKVFTKLPDFRFDPARGRFEGWVAVLADHTCLDYLRSRALRPSIPWEAAFDKLAFARELPPDAAFAARSLQGEIRAVIENLGGQVSSWSHQVLQLRWIEGLSATEIALSLNVKPQQVWYAHHRGWPILCERIRQAFSDLTSFA